MKHNNWLKKLVFNLEVLDIFHCHRILAKLTISFPEPVNWMYLTSALSGGLIFFENVLCT